MPDVPGVLADTSIWVAFFRFAQSAEALDLENLLQARAVRTCAPVRAEVLSGARTRRELAGLREWFKGVPLLELPPDVWEQIEEARFTLARKGHQASLIDLMIACTAAHHKAPLWTLDAGFDLVQGTLPFPRYHSEARVGL